MAEADREKWNAIYERRGPAVAKPAAFLEEAREVLPPGGAALDLAGGRGRNALWLAGRGFDVTLADISAVALEHAQASASAAGLSLSTVEIDLDTISDDADGRDHDPLGRSWDVVLLFHFLDRALLATISRLLVPGGVLLFCQPTVRNLEAHERPSRRFLLEEGELETLLDPSLEIVSLVEDWSSEGRHEARLVARRRAPLS